MTLDKMIACKRAAVDKRIMFFRKSAHRIVVVDRHFTLKAVVFKWVINAMYTESVKNQHAGVKNLPIGVTLLSIKIILTEN